MRLLILGTGRMAASHAEAFAEIPDVELAGCVDIRAEVAKAFAETHNIPEFFDSLDEALARSDIDAVINCTPDAAHYSTTMAAIAAGKHVFCEKPLATSYALAQEMADAAKDAGIVNGVNLTYRNVSALQAAQSLVVSGTLGEVKHFEASYRQSWLAQPAWGDWRERDEWLWRLSTAHGSLGVAGDVGVHIFDFLSFAADQRIAEIHPMRARFDKAPGEKIKQYTLDAHDSVVMTARLEGGAIGVVHATRYATGHLNDLSLFIHGDKGAVHVTNEGKLGKLSVCIGDDLQTGTWQEQSLEPVTTTYRSFIDALKSGAKMDPDFAWAAQLQLLVDDAAGVA